MFDVFKWLGKNGDRKNVSDALWYMYILYTFLQTRFFFFFLPESTIFYFSFKYVLTESINITKTRLYNFDPLKPHFYKVKLGFTGGYMFFLFC